MLAVALVVGVVVDEPILRSYASGARLQFTLCRDRRNGEECYTVVAWRRAATRLAKQVQMGQTLLVLGDQVIQSWQDERGQWHRRVELTVQAVRELPCTIDVQGQPMGWSYTEEIVDEADG